MPRDSSRPRKRKFRGNQFSQPKEKAPKSELKEDDEQIDRTLSASSKKLRPKKPKAENKEAKSEVKNKKPDISGYRLVDMEVLASVFELIRCRDCGKLSIILSEVCFKRKGCSSCLRLFCTSCGWNHSFYTSKKVKKHFEVNRRLVYGMRSIGQGASSAKRFCGVMNIPPTKPNAYQGHNKALMKAAKTVAEETMNSAANEIHNLSHEENKITKCGVSCDGTWQRRGHSSMNGCVTVISMETGKCLDVEVLSKVCQGCQRHETKEVAHFNIGSQAAVNIFHQLGLEPGEFCLQEFKMADNLRIQKGNVEATEESKKRRKILRAQRKRKGDKAQENEGVTYAAGAF